MSFPLLAWSLTIAALIHIFEEFVFPGGFKAWWCAYRPEIAASVTNRFLVIINVVLIVFSATVAFAAQRRGNGVEAWLVLAALLAGNGVFHVVGAIKTNSYSPGMISGVLLYIPLAIYGYFYFERRGRASPIAEVFAAVLGASYYFISIANHRRRARTPRH